MPFHVKMPVAAIYGSIFDYPRVREIFYPEYSKERDVLTAVNNLGWYPLTSQQRQKLETYFSDIKNMEKMQIIPETRSQTFGNAHAKAIVDWKAIWSILLQKSKFNALFAKELRYHEIDAIKQLTEWEFEQRESQGAQEGTGSGLKPTAGGLHEQERDLIHEWIFGSAGFTVKRKIQIPREQLLPFTEAAYLTAWDRDSNRSKASLQKLDNNMKAIEEFWNSWIDPSVLKLPANLKKWIRHLERTRVLAAWMCAATAEEKLKDYLATINHVLASKDDTMFQAVGICTLPAEQIRRMADMIDEEEFEAMSTIWGGFLTQDSSENPLHSVPSAPADLLDHFLRSTMGVEKQLNLSSNSLLLSMGAELSPSDGFLALPGLNWTAPPYGWYAWDADGHTRQQSFDAQVTANQERMKGTLPISAGFVPLDLRWHQLCGIHAMLTHICTPRDDLLVDGQIHSRRGILVSDEVGVGKTAQTIAVISQMMHWKHLQDMGKPLPSVHAAAGGTGHFLFGEYLLPNAPHIIVAPVSLIPHWEMEIKTWMGRHAEVFVYSGSHARHGQFFGPTGPFRRSKQVHDYRKILLVSSTALASDVKVLLEKKRQPSATGIAKKLSGAGEGEEYTLLHQKEFGLIIVDEAHEHRTGGGGFEGLLFLRDRAAVMISATATPLYTGSRDLRNIGRINNLGEFMTEKAEEDESVAARITARVRKLQTQLKETKDEDAEEVGEELREKLAEMLLDVSKIRQAFGGTIIRRELSSSGEGGKGTVTGMKPFWYQTAYLDLDLAEKYYITQIEEITSRDVEIKEDIDSISLLFESSGFYLRLRQASINAACVYATMSDTKIPPIYSSMSDFNERASSKEKAVITIIKHHQPLANRQQNPLSWTKEGVMSIETRACEPPEISRPGCTKYVIYTEFTSLMRYLQSALDVHDMPYLLLTGQSGNAKKRSEIIEKFQRGTEVAILLLSNVGKVGINLSAANILIVMDPLFSNQEFRQILGRVGRYPQFRQVMAYRLIALGTADTTLQDIADNKDTLLNAFNSTKSTTTKAILRDILGESVDEAANAIQAAMDGSDDSLLEGAASSDEVEHKKHKKSKTKTTTKAAKKGKQKAIMQRQTVEPTKASVESMHGNNREMDSGMGNIAAGHSMDELYEDNPLFLAGNGSNEDEDEQVILPLQAHSPHSASQATNSSGDEEHQPPKSTAASEAGELTDDFEMTESLLALPDTNISPIVASQARMQAPSQRTLGSFLLSNVALSKHASGKRRRNSPYGDEDPHTEEDGRPLRGEPTQSQQEARNAARQQLMGRQHPPPAGSSDDEQPPAKRRAKSAASMALAHSSIDSRKDPRS